MSISAQGRSRLNWVWRWRRGFCSAVSPAIHILAGENVCIQAMTPTQLGVAVAARQSSWIDSGVVTTGFETTRTGIAADSSSAAGDLSSVVLDHAGAHPRRTAAGFR